MYTNDIFHMAVVDSTPANALALTAAAVVKRYVAGEAFQVRRFAAVIQTATNGASVVKLKLYPTFGSNVGEVVLATLNIPTGLAAGQVIYANLDSAKISLGQELVVEVTSAAATAGKFFPMIGAYEQAEQPQNVATYTLTT